MSDGKRIAWFTPLRPVVSGISNYNEELLGVLGRFWPIDVYVDGYDPAPFAGMNSLRILPAREFERRDKRVQYSCVVYQFGNSPAHAYMYDLALRRPGVLVLHDIMLHHLMLSMVTRRGGAKRYCAMMAERYGEEGRLAAERVLLGRLPSGLFDFPLSESLIERSRHVIVHSDFSRRQVLEWLPAAPISVVPMGIRLPPVIASDAARRALNLPMNAFIAASITFVNPYKRLDVVLQALRRLNLPRPVYVLVAGGVSAHVPLQRWISMYGLDGVVEVLGFVDDRDARMIAAASDVLVNLRYPTAGETSASLLRLMAAGRPVLVSDSGSFRELPDDVVIKVPVDALEAETIEAFLRALASSPDLARQVGDSARRFIENEHSLNQMVAGYAKVLRDGVGLELPSLHPVDVVEEIDLRLDQSGSSVDPTIEAAAKAMQELGLAHDARISTALAESLVELGVFPAKMDNDGRVRDSKEGNRALNDQQSQPISDELLEILACPVCKTAVHLDDGKLVCDSCGRRYRIDDGIPIMLVDEAEMPDPASGE